MLNAQTLATEIHAEMKKKGFEKNDVNEKWFAALSEALVKHVAKNAEVGISIEIASGSSAGVWKGKGKVS